jgi:glycosyltransferase involved in cell wall biosynthesis
MRILLINYEYPPVGGGAATATAAIAKALVDLGHAVVILTGKFKRSPEVSESNGIVVHRIPSLRTKIDRSGVFEMGLFLISGLIFARSIIRIHRIEGSIVFFSLPCGPLGLLGRWRFGIPYVVSLRGGDVPGNEPSLNFFHRLLAPVRRTVLKNAVAIVANSDGLRKMAEAADPFPVRIIPNGVDSDFFVPAQPKPAKKSAGVLRVLFVGRFQPQKNLAFLFREMARLSPDTFELHLVGDGPDRQSLARLAKQLGMASMVTWHGWLPRAAVRQAYQGADCLVNPSLYEGMPNVVLEAMACGLPVVASKVPGNEELVLDGETGFLFDLEAPNALMNRLKQLADDRDLCSRLGRRAQSHATTTFSWGNVAQAYLALFSRSLI